MRRRRYRRPRPKIEPIIRQRVNEQIRVPRVLLIDADGTKVGEIDTTDAILRAREQELDLVEVSPNAKPPVCRVLDFGKFQYQQTKQIQQARAKQKKVETKGIRLGMRTDIHDLAFKRVQAEKFLTKGNKVKIELILRGREKALPGKARDNVVSFMKSLTLPYKIEEEIKRFPGGFHVIIVPE